MDFSFEVEFSTGNQQLMMPIHIFNEKNHGLHSFHGRIFQIPTLLNYNAFKSIQAFYKIYFAFQAFVLNSTALLYNHAKVILMLIDYNAPQTFESYINIKHRALKSYSKGGK